MIVQKFLRVQQRPEQVFVAVAFCPLGIERFASCIIARLDDIIFANPHFIGGGFAGKGGEVEFADALGFRHLSLAQGFGSSSAGGQLGLHVCGVHEVQALCEAGGLHALALADTGTFRTAEDLEKGRGAVVAVVRQ